MSKKAAPVAEPVAPPVPADRRKKLDRVERAAERLDCSKWQVYRLIKDGKLKHIRMGKARGIRVDTDSYLDSYLDEAQPATE